MTNDNEGPSITYLTTLLRYYEEEVRGEAYFYALAEHFEETEKVALLARVERAAAESVRPLVEKYQLETTCQTDLHRRGRSNLYGHQAYSWIQFMAYIIERYPRYLVEFKALENMAPADDFPALQHLTEHQGAVIEFAGRELNGDSDSIQPLLEYLA